MAAAAGRGKVLGIAGAQLVGSLMRNTGHPITNGLVLLTSSGNFRFSQRGHSGMHALTYTPLAPARPVTGSLCVRERRGRPSGSPKELRTPTIRFGRTICLKTGLHRGTYSELIQ